MLGRPGRCAQRGADRPSSETTGAARRFDGSSDSDGSYVAEHVGLAYALTIHKAQRTTADQALVVVDEQMSAAQLYVAMSGGREENRALVVTDGRAPLGGPGRVVPDPRREHVREKDDEQRVRQDGPALTLGT